MNEMNNVCIDWLSINIPIILPVSSSKEERKKYAYNFFENFILKKLNIFKEEVDWLPYSGKNYRQEGIIFFGQYMKFGICSLDTKRISYDEYTKWFNDDESFYKDLNKDIDGSTEFYYMSLIFSGQACREFEERFDLSWNVWLDYLINGFHAWATRIDLACDLINYKGFKFSTIVDFAKREWYTSIFKTVSKIYDDGDGQGIYFGQSRGSNCILFYNKMLERIKASYEINEGVESWLRIEQRFFSNAKEIGELLATTPQEEYNLVYKQILYNNLDFKKINANASSLRGENLDRCETIYWWKILFKDIEKLKVKNQHRLESTISTTKKWIEKETGVGVAKLCCMEDNVYSDLINANNLKINGIEQLMKRPKELSKVNNQLLLKGKPIMSNGDLLKKKEELKALNNFLIGGTIDDE